MSIIVAIVGAESTGKTTLANTLADALRERSMRAACVDEYLREFCDQQRRTPYRHEQADIARTQTQRIAAAAQTRDVVIADTTALMTAVYSESVFGDCSLYPAALRDHGRCTLTLLTALDLPWQADGLQRAGPHVRAPVDTLLRAALARASIGYHLVTGSGSARLENALAIMARAWG